MDTNILIALLAGMVFGWIVDYWLVRMGLTRLEWKLVVKTYRMIRSGNYKITEAWDDGPDH